MRAYLTSAILGLFAVTAGLAQDDAPGRFSRETTALADTPRVRDAVRLLNLWIDEQMTWQQIPGLALGVVHDDELVWAHGYGVADLETGQPVTSQTLFRMGSVTKLFTATAVMRLRDAGKLRLDDPVADHLPWFRVQIPFEGASPITVRHLLTHTSGLPREGAFPYWTTHEFPTLEELEASLPELETLSPPGAKYRYSNLGIALLGALVAEVSGESYAAYVRRNILGPLGMASTTLDLPREDLRGLASEYMRKNPGAGSQVAGAGTRRQHTYYQTRALAPAANMISNVEDMARFASLHLPDTVSDRVTEGPEILGRYTLAEMRRPQFVYDSWGGGRGLGFGISHDEGTTFVVHGGWVGGHRSHLLLVPEEGIGVVAMTNGEDVSPSDFTHKAYEIVGKAIVEVTAEPSPEPRADPGWQRLVGTYSDPWGWESRVLVLDDRLVMYDSSYPPVEDPEDNLTSLEPVEGEVDTFRMPDGGHVVFESTENGRVERLRRNYQYLYPVEAEEGRRDAQP